jgi:hypothetical protein
MAFGGKLPKAMPKLPHVGGGPVNTPGPVTAADGPANPAMLGGQGMAVGPLHTPSGGSKNPKANPRLSRLALLSGLKG